MADSAIKLSNIQVVAQVSGVPGSDNAYNAGEWKPSAGANYSQPISALDSPTILTDTRKWDAFGADLGFSWDAGNGTVLTAFGDTFGFNWVNQTNMGGAGSSTIAAGSDGVDLTTLTGSQTLSVASAASSLKASPGIVGIRLQSGYFAYIKVTSNSGTTTLTGCKFLAGTGPGPWVCHTGDVIAGQDSGWSGLTNRSDVGWRSQTLAVSSDKDITNGYKIDNMLPLSSAGTAKQIFVSAHTASGIAALYNQSVSYTSCTVAGGFATFTQSVLTVVAGQWLRLSGTSSSGIALGNYQVLSVNNTNKTFTIGLVSGSGAETTVVVSAANNANYKRPTLANEDSPIPTGGVSVPYGAGNRQYLFFMDVIRFEDPGSTNVGHWFTNYLGIGYSDDYGQTWVKASTDATVAASGSNTTAAVTSFTGSQTLNVNNTNLPSTGGTIEVDTTTGLAYLSYQSRTSNVLNGVNYIRGSGNLQGTTSGVRYGMWANNASYTGLHQQAWPWRPGDGYVYLMTILNGRFGLPSIGSARIARVPENSILSIAEYSYFTGFDGSGNPIWSFDKNAATNIFPDSRYVGEPSFYYHEGTGLYVTTYLETAYNYSGVGGIVIRTATNPWGPWSNPSTVFLASEFGNADLYGGFIHPWSNLGSTACATGPTGTVKTSASGGNQTKNSFYFHISLFNPYSTYLVKATLTPPTGFLAFM